MGVVRKDGVVWCLVGRGRVAQFEFQFRFQFQFQFQFQVVNWLASIGGFRKISKI